MTDKTEIVDPFWTEEPSILIRNDRLLEFFISNDQSVSEKLNSIARFGLYTSLILSMYHKNVKYLTLCILTFSITYLIYTNLKKDKIESLEINSESTEEFTKPTINNPFGNSSIMDIIDNPKRKPMVEYKEYNDKTLQVKEDIEKAFNYNLYKDLDDLYGKTNSQRQFYTTPSRGTIPSDPDGQYKEWLYGKSSSCKNNTYDCLNNIYESPRTKRQIMYNPNENPDNTEAKKN